MKTLVRSGALAFVFGLPVLFSVLCPRSSVFAQGSLTPPGAPGPTMKALDQIASTGIAINATNTPPAGAYLYVISASGSYYLTGNVTVVSNTGSGIHVTAAGVTIDMNGFQISGSASSGDGIDIDATAHRCTVTNGTITGFSIGAFANGSRGGSFLQLAVSACSSNGLQAGDGWQIDRCKAHDNTGNAGIYAGSGNTLTNCTATSNTGTYGIFAGNGSTLANCTAYNNTCRYGIFTSSCALTNCAANFNQASSAFSCGIYADASTVTGCTANGNTNTNATPGSSTGIGIDVSGGSTVQGCTANNNKGDGIQALGSCQLIQNNASSNGNGNTAPNGDGIHTTFRNNRIEGNHSMNNLGYGIHSSFSATADYIVRNTAFGNSGTVVAGSDANYSPNTGTYFGPLSTPGSATSPWANF